MQAFLNFVGKNTNPSQAENGAKSVPEPPPNVATPAAAPSESKASNSSSSSEEDSLDPERNALRFQSKATSKMITISLAQVIAVSITLCYALIAMYRFFSYDNVLTGITNSTFLFATILAGLILPIIAAIYQALSYHTQRVTALDELHLTLASARGGAIITSGIALLLLMISITLLAGKSEWREPVMENIERLISVAGNKKEIAKEINHLQFHFECCGVNKNGSDPSLTWLGNFRLPYIYSDFMRIRESVPWSCCDPHSSTVPCYNVRWERYWLHHESKSHFDDEQDAYEFDEHRTTWDKFEEWTEEGKYSVRTNRDCATVFYSALEWTIFIPLGILFMFLSGLFAAGSAFSFLTIFQLKKKTDAFLEKKLADPALQSNVEAGKNPPAKSNVEAEKKPAAPAPEADKKPPEPVPAVQSNPEAEKKPPEPVQAVQTTMQAVKNPPVPSNMGAVKNSPVPAMKTTVEAVKKPEPVQAVQTTMGAVKNPPAPSNIGAVKGSPVAAVPTIVGAVGKPRGALSKSLCHSLTPTDRPMTVRPTLIYIGDCQQNMSRPSSSWIQPPPPVIPSDRRYTIQGELGKGAYGTVYRVLDTMTGREFAMKRILVRRNDEGIPQSLLREISTLRSLQRIAHDNITRMFDVFASNTSDLGGFDHCINVIYEKCDWDLHDFLKMIPRNLGDSQVRHLARQLFEGLDFLHTHGVIHRDLKPQNILVNRNHTLKIADFGLARTYTLHSTFTTVVVTLWYRSPELLLQCKYNASIDIWSAGCILVELYTRQPLFPCSTEVRQLRTIFNKMGTPPAHYWPADAVVDSSSFPFCPAVPMCRLAPPLMNAPNSIDLVLRTLHFLPHMRPSAAECLEHPYFANFVYQRP